MIINLKVIVLTIYIYAGGRASKTFNQKSLKMVPIIGTNFIPIY